jgi:hypothetical protein
MLAIAAIILGGSCSCIISGGERTMDIAYMIEQPHQEPLGIILLLASGLALWLAGRIMFER